MKKMTGLMVLVAIMAAGFVVNVYAAEEKVEKMAATDRSQVDADFAIQGEYLAERKTEDGGSRKIGMQVVALGDGKFDIVGFPGGLPGDGWLGKEKTAEITKNMPKLTAETVDGKVVVTGAKDVETKEVGTIADGKLTLNSPRGDHQIVLDRIERKSPTLGLKAPEGATIVFNAEKKINATTHEINEYGVLYSNFYTKDEFSKPYTAHIEFMLQYMPYARGQARSNSGCYFFSAYEVQVLDSFGLEGVDNECGGIYKVAAPKVNMCLPPLQWQTYDVDFTPPVFEDGKKVKNARITVKHNGVVIQDDLEIPQNTPGPKGEADEARPIFFQGHGNKVQYRNIWVKEKE